MSESACVTVVPDDDAVAKDGSALDLSLNGTVGFGASRYDLVDLVDRIEVLSVETNRIEILVVIGSARAAINDLSRHHDDDLFGACRQSSRSRAFRRRKSQV